MRKITIVNLLANIAAYITTFSRNSEVLPLTEEQKSAIVRSHNIYRNAVSPRAANMNALLWSEQLSLRALEWARHCKNQKQSPPFRDPFWGALGENRWISSSANLEPDRAVDLWWSEVKGVQFFHFIKKFLFYRLIRVFLEILVIRG